MESNPIVSIARYHARLERLAVNTFAAAQQPYQFALEAAIEDLTAGKGAKRLADVEKRLASAMTPMATAIARAAIEINETVYTKEGNKDVLRQVDRFLEGRAALRRSVKLTSYDAESSTTFPRPSQQLPPQRIVTLRTSQMTALKRIYGLEVDAKTRQPTADARENQAALAALGRKGLRLHSDDDWRPVREGQVRAEPLGHQTCRPGARCRHRPAQGVPQGVHGALADEHRRLRRQPADAHLPAGTDRTTGARLRRVRAAHRVHPVADSRPSVVEAPPQLHPAARARRADRHRKWSARIPDPQRHLHTLRAGRAHTTAQGLEHARREG